MNKKWVKDDECWKLIVTPFYEEEAYALMTKDEDGYWYSSEILNVELDVLCADTLKEAQEDIEEQIKDYFQDKIYYYEELLNKFEQ